MRIERSYFQILLRQTWTSSVNGIARWACQNARSRL